MAAWNPKWSPPKDSIIKGAYVARAHSEELSNGMLDHVGPLKSERLPSIKHLLDMNNEYVFVN